MDVPQMTDDAIPCLLTMFVHPEARTGELMNLSGPLNRFLDGIPMVPSQFGAVTTGRSTKV
jgi:hypothetical protein